MKSTILSLSFLFFFGQTLAQNAPIDFESGGHGASWTWTTFENVDNPALEIVSNPDQTAPNTSATVAKFTARNGGQPWAGCESEHGSDIGTFTLDASTSTIRIMVYKSVISDVGIKLVESNSASLGEIKVANTKTDEWEELTFDFSSREGIAYDQIVIFMDFASRTSDNVCYFDNITFGAGTAIAEPTAAAADPTFDQSDVISMFCGVYSDVNVDTWRTGWSSATLTDTKVSNNDVKKYTALDFVGIETVGSNLIDVSAMDHFNLAIWTPNSTKFKIKLVDFGADGAYQGGDDSEHQVEFDNLTTEEWVYLRIPLTDFTNLTSTEHIAQLIFSSEPIGQSIVYIDNVFFSKNSTAGTQDKASMDQVKVYPNPASETLHVQIPTNVSSKALTIVDLRGKAVQSIEIPTGTAVHQVDVSALQAGTYFLRAQTTNGVLTQKLIIH